MFSYDAAQKEHGKLIYNDVSMLLVLVIADNALFGITSVEDLQEMEISPGQDEQILHFNEKALDEYILKKCTKAEGVIDAPMPKSAFLAIFQGRSKECVLRLRNPRFTLYGDTYGKKVRR